MDGKSNLSVFQKILNNSLQTENNIPINQNSPFQNNYYQNSFNQGFLIPNLTFQNIYFLNNILYPNIILSQLLKSKKIEKNEEKKNEKEEKKNEEVENDNNILLNKKKKEMENYVQIVLINFLLIMQKECVQIVITQKEEVKNLGIVLI